MASLSTRTIRRRISDGPTPAHQYGRRSIWLRLNELERALNRITRPGSELPAHRYDVTNRAFRTLVGRRLLGLGLAEAHSAHYDAPHSWQ